MVKCGGDRTIKNWIDTQFKYKNYLIILIGSEIANRVWIKYEIKCAGELGGATIRRIYII
ncbi:TIR domain-containing protein [Acinetobacter schindleri]|uniref:TIR domain-containing protein n=1 Tax=Acinetobacter schindleri TaxID=108981 RepID=UPI003399A568